MAALVALLLPTPARAAVYELASEWMTVSFKDGDKDMLLFTHLPDSDIFLQMKNYFTDSSSKTPSVDLYVPLQQLIQTDTGAGTVVAAKSLVLTSRPTPYKMLIRFDTRHHHHVIQRPPDFTTRDSTTSATILSVFGVKTEHPENFLVMVLPERPAGLVAGLNDIELAAINSLESSERAALAGECGGEPGAPAALGCWREKIGLLLNRHQEEAPSQGLSPFEQRYIQNRLSRKGYEQFESLRSAADDGGKLSLAGNWHQAILGQDIAANAAAVKIDASATAPVVAATPLAVKTTSAAVAAVVPRVPPTVPKIIKSRKGPDAVPAVVPMVLPASPAANTVPARARWKIILAVLLILAIIGVIIARR